jgi:hypothetical protein
VLNVLVLSGREKVRISYVRLARHGSHILVLLVRRLIHPDAPPRKFSRCLIVSITVRAIAV